MLAAGRVGLETGVPVSEEVPVHAVRLRKRGEGAVAFEKGDDLAEGGAEADSVALGAEGGEAVAAVGAFEGRDAVGARHVAVEPQLQLPAVERVDALAEPERPVSLRRLHRRDDGLKVDGRPRDGRIWCGSAAEEAVEEPFHGSGGEGEGAAESMTRGCGAGRGDSACPRSTFPL